MSIITQQDYDLFRQQYQQSPAKYPTVTDPSLFNIRKYQSHPLSTQRALGAAWVISVQKLAPHL